MSIGIESLFTSPLGFGAPWWVERVELDTYRRRIAFELASMANRPSCPHCEVPGQGVHDRIKRALRHLDFFQYQARLQGEYLAMELRARQEGAEIHWANETALVNTDVRGASFAPAGKTPVARTVGGTRQKRSIIATVTNQGKARWMIIVERTSVRVLGYFQDRRVRYAA